MGHAGAIVSGGKGGAKEKMEYLRRKGVKVVDLFTDIGAEIERAFHFCRWTGSGWIWVRG